MNKLASFYGAWLKRDAAWWQFWLPSSGLAGGTIAGLILFGGVRLLAAHVT